MEFVADVLQRKPIMQMFSHDYSMFSNTFKHLKGKGSFYIAQYPVRWTAQSASHFLPPILARQQLRAKAKSLTFPPLSIARYSFIQLSEQGRQWRERKCPIFETVTKVDSNPVSLDCESGILPLSYRAPRLKSRESSHARLHIIMVAHTQIYPRCPLARSDNQRYHPRTGRHN